MLASLNALGIISLVIFAIYMLYKHASKQLSLKRTVMAFFITLAVLMIDSTILVTMCARGNPIFQWLIPSIAMFFVLLLIPEQSIRRKTALALFILSIVLSFHYKYLIKTDSYTGQSSLRFEGEKEISISSTSANLDDLDKKHYDAGWVSDVFPNMNPYSDYYPLYKTRRGELWHSSFTGLYEDLNGPLIKLWYKGGNIKDDNSDMLEFREYK